jgi:HSP20 family protein
MYRITQPENFYRGMFDFRRDFDEIFNQLLTEWPVKNERKLFGTVPFTPAVEAWIEPETKKFYLKVAVPGVDPKDVKITAHENTLTISGERKFIKGEKEVNYLHREFLYGTFERVLPLPDGVDVEKMVAEFNNGVLEINAPMLAAALPRKIEIRPLLKKVA